MNSIADPGGGTKIEEDTEKVPVVGVSTAIAGSTVAINFDSPTERTDKHGVDKSTSGVDARNGKTLTNGRKEDLLEDSSFPSKKHTDKGACHASRIETSKDGIS